MRLPPRAPAEQLLSAGATKELGHKLAVAFLETTDIHYVTIFKKCMHFITCAGIPVTTVLVRTGMNASCIKRISFPCLLLSCK